MPGALIFPRVHAPSSAQAGVMASRLTDIVTNKLLDVREVFMLSLIHI